MGEAIEKELFKENLSKSLASTMALKESTNIIDFDEYFEYLSPLRNGNCNALDLDRNEVGKQAQTLCATLLRILFCAFLVMNAVVYVGYPDEAYEQMTDLDQEEAGKRLKKKKTENIDLNMRKEKNKNEKEVFYESLFEKDKCPKQMWILCSIWRLSSAVIEEAKLSLSRQLK